MKNYTISFILTTLISQPILSADMTCKNLKVCADWASEKTSAKYDLGNLDRRSIKLEKNFSLSEGDPDFLFNFLLLQNNFARVKREDGVYQIIQNRELKNFQFTLVKEEVIPNTLDFYSVEFAFSNKAKVQNAMQVFKKYISKEGRLLEVSDSPKLLVTDSGIQLQALRSIAHELNK